MGSEWSKSVVLSSRLSKMEKDWEVMLMLLWGWAEGI
jgi:hypothetical protein